MSPSQIVQIPAGTAGTALTPEQKRFNTLTRQIGQWRAKLGAWQANVPLFARTYGQVVAPLLESARAERVEWLVGIDAVFDQPGWTGSERRTMSALIREEASLVLESRAAPDQRLEALFEKHADVDFETEQQTARDGLRSMFEAMTGIDIGDADPKSNEELFQHMRERLAAQAEANADAGAEAPDAGAATRRKSAAAKRRAAEAELATQSVREIYRKLASALHPDRETDPARRDEKTALMTKVNQAYQAGDLLALLELQLQTERVDVSHVASATPQRVKHYNKVLAEQLDELKAEVERTELAFRADYDLGFGIGFDPQKLFPIVEQLAAQVRAVRAEQRRDMRLFADRGAMKRWLKRERQRQREDDEGFDFSER